jgi:hypothetical protein
MTVCTEKLIRDKANVRLNPFDSRQYQINFAFVDFRCSLSERFGGTGLEQLSEFGICQRTQDKSPVHLLL